MAATVNGNGHVGTSGNPRGKVSSAVAADYVRPEDPAIDEITDRMDEDYQVRLARWVMEANIRNVPVTIETDSQDPRANALIEHIRRLWDETLTSMFDAIPKGRAAFEKVYGYDAANNLHYFKTLEPIEFKLSRLKLTDDGHYEGVELIAKNRDNPTLGPDKSWWLALRPTATQPHGRSVYAGAVFRVWQERQHEFMRRKQMIDRYVIRGGTARVPEGDIDPVTGQVIDPADKMAEALECLYAGGTLFLPNTPKKTDPTKYEYEFNESEIRTIDPAPIDALIGESDVRVLRAFGFPEKTIIEGDAVGSFALVKQQMLILFAVIESVLDEFVRSFQRFVIDKLIELNWQDNRPRITIGFLKMNNRPDSVVAQFATALIQSPELSPLVLSGVIDISDMLESSGIPLTPEIEAKIAAMLATERERRARQPAAAFTGFPGFGQEQQTDMANGETVPLSVSWSDMLERSVMELDRLWQEMLTLGAALRDADAVHQQSIQERLLAILQEFRTLEADTRLAARLMGMVSPWKPSLQDAPQGADASQTPIDLALGDPPTPDARYPFLRDAIEFLQGKQVVTASDFAKLNRQEKLAAFSVPREEDIGFIDQIRDIVVESITPGEDVPTVRKRLEERLSAPRFQLETLVRTNTKQSYLAGKDETMSRPEVASEYPYVMYVATADPRTRPSHAALNTLVAARGSRAHRLFEAAAKDWNCRCDLLFLTASQGEARGVVEFEDLPEVSIQEYGEAVL